jgi:hypothetical protein
MNFRRQIARALIALADKIDHPALLIHQDRVMDRLFTSDSHYVLTANIRLPLGHVIRQINPTTYRIEREGYHE